MVEEPPRAMQTLVHQLSPTVCQCVVLIQTRMVGIMIVCNLHPYIFQRNAVI